MKFAVYCPDDADDIERLVHTTFTDADSRAEGDMVARLVRDFMSRTAAADLYGFTATEDERLIGVIFFSRMRFASGINAFILAPVAIHTNHQGKGIGQALIAFGLHALKEDGVSLVLTYGDPRFYTKVGFIPIPETLVPAPLTLTRPEGWLAQSLTGETITPLAGPSRCVNELARPEYW